MNISFHYYTVKTLCHYAGFDEKRAQDIAFYSQFVDDFNLSTICGPDSMMLIKGRMPDFFLDKHLALKDSVNDAYLFYPATTGIRLAQSVYSILNKLHQIYTIIPFHFIPQKKYSDGEPAQRCRPARPGDKSLMDRLMSGFLDEKAQNDMKFGLLLHVYADTYAHQNFSGGWEEENYCKPKSIRKNGGREELASWKDRITYYLPAVGHAELNHVPDAFGLDFTAEFTVPLDDGRQIYERSNMDTFLSCAEILFGLLSEYGRNTNTAASRTGFERIRPRIKNAGMACLNGTDEIYDAEKLAGAWNAEFPDIAYSYKHDPMWSLRKSEKKGWDGEPIYEADDRFFAFNRCAYEHLHAVLGRYRVCLFD